MVSDKSICGIRIGVIPDYLQDHTLLHDTIELRMEEIFHRWLQFIGRLWWWGPDVTFCLRYCSRPSDRSVVIYLLASHPDATVIDALQDDLVTALLASEAILPDLEGVTVVDFGESEFGEAISPISGGKSIWGMVQKLSNGLWVDKSAGIAVRKACSFTDAQCKLDDDHLWIPLQWAGPEGSYTWILRTLTRLSHPTRVSIYLTPIKMSSDACELEWLDKLAQCARNVCEEYKTEFARLAAERAEFSLHRLLDAPFACAMDFVSLDCNSDLEIEQLVRSMQASCRIQTLRQENNTENFHAASFSTIAAAERLEEALSCHNLIKHPYWIADPEVPSFLIRLQHLTDARGASAFFRLPISVGDGAPGIEVRQPPPDFCPGPSGGGSHRRKPPDEGKDGQDENLEERLHLGTYFSGGMVEFPIDQLVKHTLITGATGSGKTNTVMFLLQQLWTRYRVPFLVIEPVKTEYRALLNCDLSFDGIFGAADGCNTPLPLIYTLGDEATAPFRLNPFQVMAGIRIEAHIGRLQTCFEAALGLFGPLYSILEEALVAVYRDLGWRLIDEGHDGDQRYPTMTEFANKLEEIAESRSYVGEVGHNIRAAIHGRIKPLTRSLGSSKGLLFDCRQTTPSVDLLLKSPAILELNGLNSQSRALASMFLLVILREYRERMSKSQPEPGRSLQHLCVLEEAHNIFGYSKQKAQGESGTPDPEHQSSESFVSLLLEIRALGEGLVIADQSPNRLVPDVLRNTSLQIAHNLRGTDDRGSIARSMLMTNEQEEYLAKLRPGSAAIFFAELHRATFINVPEQKFLRQLAVTDRHVENHMAALTDCIRICHRPFEDCKSCTHYETCDFRWNCRTTVTNQTELIRSIRVTLRGLSRETKNETLPSIAKTIRLFQLRLGMDDPRQRRDHAWCLLLHFAAMECPKGVKENFLEHLRHDFTEAMVPIICDVDGVSHL